MQVRKRKLNCFTEIFDDENLPTQRRPLKRRKNDSNDSKVSVDWKSVTVESFRNLLTLGQGQFADVDLVKETSSGNLYAMKSIYKHRIDSDEGAKRLFQEKECLQTLDSCWIIKLHTTLQDNERVHFVLELCSFPEFTVFLEDQGVLGLPEDWARFYASNVLLALEHMHSRGVAYRDLKPENIMMTETGYLKLVDLGFAKKMDQNEKTYSFGGTVEYMAPEMLTKAGHDHSIDLWCLGIFIFELLHGDAPFRFHHASRKEVSSRVKIFTTQLLNNEYKFPRQLKTQAKNIISNLLRQEPHDRLGFGTDGFDALKKHQWFANIDFEKLENQDPELAPYCPPKSLRNQGCKIDSTGRHELDFGGGATSFQQDRFNEF